jgi:tetratricopeptide (TPR) repeat protein
MFPYYRFPIYWQLEWNGTPEKTHNVFLQVLATQGIAGFGFYALMFLVFLKKSFNLIFGEKDMVKRYLVFGFFMGAIAYFIQGLFNYTVVAYGAFYWMALAVIFTAGSQGGKTLVLHLPEWLADFTAKNRALALGALTLVMITLSAWVARYWTGDMYYKVGNIAVATDKDEYSTYYYQKAVELAPGREIYWVKYGIAFEKLMRKEQNPQKRQQYANEALRIHNLTIRMNDRNGYNYNNMARVYKFYGEALDRSKYADAVKLYLEAVKRDTNNAYFGLDLATVYINMQDYAKAEEMCKKYMELYPEYAVPLSYLGYIKMLQGQDMMQEARKYYELAISRTEWHKDVMTQASTYSNLGILYYNLKMYRDAESMFLKVVALRPGAPDGYMNLAKLYEIFKNKAGAIEMLREGLKYNPENPALLQALQSLGAR